MTSKHEKLLQKYAEVIVKVGLNLQKGQRLIITNSRVRGVPLSPRRWCARCTRAAYQAGARYVDVIWGDEELLRIRLQNASRESLVEYPKWQIAAQMDMIEHRDALLTILADDPDADERHRS